MTERETAPSPEVRYLRDENDALRQELTAMRLFIEMVATAQHEAARSASDLLGSLRRPRGLLTHNED